MFSLALNRAKTVTQSLSDCLRKFNKNLTKDLDRFLENKIWVGLFLGVLVFASKLVFLNLPFWWDEGAYLWGALRVYENNFNPFVEYWSYKPPLVFELVALGFHLFGIKRIIPRVLVGLFAFLGLYFTFLLGEKIYSKKVGFFASLLLFLSPLFFAQSALFHADLPLAVLTLIVLYSFLSEKKAGYFVAATLMVLTKEPAVLVILAILAYEGLFNLRKIFSRPFILRLLFLASPLLVFLGWMLLNKLYLGWYLWSYNVGYFSLASFSDTEELLTILDFAFWRDFRFLLALPLLSGFILSFYSKDLKKRLVKREVALFLLITIVSLLFFWWGPFLPRYLLIFQPLFFIVGTAAILDIFKKTIFSLSFLLMIILLFISCWFTPKFGWAGEENLNYLQAIRVHKEAAQFLGNNFPFSKILTTWPMTSELATPELGYVNESFDVIDFNSSFKIKEKMIAVVSKNNLLWQEETKNLLVFLQSSGVSEYPLAVFDSGGEGISLYFLQP